MEGKITFLLDASQNLTICGTEYYIRGKKDEASVKAHVLERKPCNIDQASLNEQNIFRWMCFIASLVIFSQEFYICF